MSILPDDGLDLIFREARTQNAWTDQPVGEVLLEAVYDLAKWGPTSANCSPMRLIFVVGKEAKERLRPCLIPGNVDKTMAAPATAIVAYDTRFHEHLPTLFPHTDAKSWFDGNAPLIEETAFRNSSLQGAYLIIAARALGLDCGPMSGFDAAKLNAEFFPDGRFKANFLCNIGHGDGDGLFPRSPRFTFDDVCQIL